MDVERKRARTVGVMLIIGTVAGMLSVAFTGSILGSPDYLTEISANTNDFVTGILLVLTMGLTLAMVPVLLFPVFKKYNETLALGAVVFRGVLEAFLYIALVISWLLLLSLSHEYVNAEPPKDFCFQLLGTLLIRAGDQIGQILAIVFSLGALMIYYVFYQSRFIPRWLSVWGLAGAVLYLAAPLSGMFNIEWEILYAPLAIQEMVLALWLIVKGFNTSVTL